MMMTANSGLKQAIAPLEAEAEDMVISTILAEIEFKNVLFIHQFEGAYGSQCLLITKFSYRKSC